MQADDFRNEQDLEQDDYRFVDDQFDREYSSDPRKLSPRRKLAILGLAFFSLVIVVLAFAQLSKNLDTNPQVRKMLAEYNASSTCVGNNCFLQDDLVALTDRDTDQDGLSDMMEENVYKTSAYLADTDSDGINDGDEVAAGTDPNCPEGEDCSSGAGTSLQASTPELSNATTMMQATATVAMPAHVTTELSGMSVTDLRAMLKQAGMTDEMMTTISDEDILSAYQDTFANLDTISDLDSTNNISN